jgi:hypothetical protein
MPDLKVINEWLNKQEKNLFGQPIYRIVFSNSCTEIRTGVFDEVVNPTSVEDNKQYLFSHYMKYMLAHPDADPNKVLLNLTKGQPVSEKLPETREVKKYNYIDSRYILEKWFPPELSFNANVPESIQGSYEPFFVFEDKNGNYLDPTLKAIEFIILASRNPGQPRTPAEIKQMHDRVQEKEVADFIAQLTETDSPWEIGVGYSKEIANA